MYYRIVLAFAMLTASAAALAFSPCQQKAQEIEREIRYAEQHQNHSRVRGLHTALEQVRSHCRDGELQAEWRRKIAEKEAEVAERRAELQEAQRKGDAKKISKREQKLKDAGEELKALKARSY